MRDVREQMLGEMEKRGKGKKSLGVWVSESLGVEKGHPHFFLLPIYPFTHFAVFPFFLIVFIVVSET
jgi:hypothetical protein